MTCRLCHGLGTMLDVPPADYSRHTHTVMCDCQPRHIEQPSPSDDDLKYAALARMMDMQNA